MADYLVYDLIYLTSADMDSRIEVTVINGRKWNSVFVEIDSVARLRLRLLSSTGQKPIDFLTYNV
jgi:hypothetical protein